MVTFSDYDDEGYMLLTLKHFVSEGHLYTRTFSQYGPFYFFAQGLFFQVLRVPITHDGTRLVTLVYWLAAGLLAALFVRKFSSSFVFGCAAGLSCVFVGRVLASEPGHPQQVLLVMFMAAAYLSLDWDGAWGSARLALLGAVGAALIFTKINAGVFYIAALSHASFCMLKSGWLRSTGVALAIVYALIGPWFLMRLDVHGWAQNYCVIAILCGTLTFVVGAALHPRDAQPARYLWRAVCGLAAGIALIVVGARFQGVGLELLLRGVVLDPLKHPQVFSVPLIVSARVLGGAIVVTLGLLGAWLAREKSGRMDLTLSVGRVAVGFGVIFLLMRGSQHIAWMVPFLPLSLIRAGRANFSISELFPRLFITDLAATEFLQAYPVAGSQTGISASPILIWAFICIVDGLCQLQEQPERFAWLKLRRVTLGSVAAGLLLCLAAARVAIPAVRDLRSMPPASNLSGSRILHLDPVRERDYEFLTANLRANCATLFTMPGMGSLNMWSGVPSPNGWNLTAWMKGSSLEQQQEILRLIRSTPDSCAVYNRQLVEFWRTTDADLHGSPLAMYILTDMPVVLDRRGYQIRVNPNRPSVWREIELRSVYQ